MMLDQVMVLEVVHWVGSILGAAGFCLLASAVRRRRWWGAMWSLLSTAGLLIPWAVFSTHYGLLVLWAPIAAASCVGLKNNASPP
jgi:hypothetical protein